jgi:hypothetical protein
LSQVHGSRFVAESVVSDGRLRGGHPGGLLISAVTSEPGAGGARSEARAQVGDVDVGERERARDAPVLKLAIERAARITAS